MDYPIITYRAFYMPINKIIVIQKLMALPLHLIHFIFALCKVFQRIFFDLFMIYFVETVLFVKHILLLIF